MDSWVNVPIGDVLSKANRFEERDELTDYQFAGTYSFGRGIFRGDKKVGSSFQLPKIQRVHQNDFIYCKIMAWEGAFGVAPPEVDGCVLSGAFVVYEIDKSRLEPIFIDYYFRNRSVWERVGSQSTGTNVRRKSLHPEQFEAETIPLPSLDEQRRIVAKIESLNAKIDEARPLREEIKSDMDALLVSMAHRNDLSDQEKFSQGWEYVALGEVLTQVSDPVEVVPGQEYPHFGIYSFARGLFKKAPLLGDEIKASKLYRVREGQFIYGRLNAYEGAFAVISEDFDRHHVSNEFPAFACATDRVLPEFLLAYFSTPAVWEALKRKVTGIGGGAGNRRIRLKETVLLSEEIWLPTIEWQHKIKAASEKLAVTKEDRDSTAILLEALLPSILDKAFRGEL